MTASEDYFILQNKIVLFVLFKKRERNWKLSTDLICVIVETDRKMGEVLC